MSYLTVAQVADELGFSTRTVLRWIDRGELEAVRLPGGRLRVDSRTLESRLAAWSTVGHGTMSNPTASGAAQCDLPAPGKGG